MADATAADPNSTVSSLLGVSRRRSRLAPAWRRRSRARARLPLLPLPPDHPKQKRNSGVAPTRFFLRVRSRDAHELLFWMFEFFF